MENREIMKAAAAKAGVGYDEELPLAFLLAVMHSQDLDLMIRIDAAKAAAPYLHPKLNAIAMVRKDIDGGADPGFGRLFAAIEAKLALAPPEARGEVIEMLRGGESESEDGTE